MFGRRRDRSAPDVRERVSASCAGEMAGDAKAVFEGAQQAVVVQTRVTLRSRRHRWAQAARPRRAAVEVGSLVPDDEIRPSHPNAGDAWIWDFARQEVVELPHGVVRSTLVMAVLAVVRVTMSNRPTDPAASAASKKLVSFGPVVPAASTSGGTPLTGSHPQRSGVPGCHRSTAPGCGATRTRCSTKSTRDRRCAALAADSVHSCRDAPSRRAGGTGCSRTGGRRAARERRRW